MMSHRRQFVPVPNRGKRTAIIVILFIVVLVFSFRILRNILRETGSGVGMAVVHSSDTTFGIFSNIGIAFRSKASLNAENESSKSQLAEIQSRLIEHDILVSENKELKEYMGRKEAGSFVLAKILEKPSHSVYDTLIIDGGSNAGISAGQVVYVNGVIPIGKIEEVNKYSGTVRMFSSPKQNTEARLSILSGEKATYVDVTLVGRGGGNFQTIVPHDLEVPVGTLASLRGLAGGIIAEYKKTISDERDPLQTVLLTSPVNIQEINFVQVAQ